MGQRSPSCAKREARYSGINHNKDLRGSSFQIQHSMSFCRKQLQSKGALEAGRAEAMLNWIPVYVIH